MNLNQNPSRDELRGLINQCNDWAAHHQLWVAKNGDVHISQLPRELDPTDAEETNPDMQLRFPAFVAGNEYVGPAAAADDAWISELFDRLMDEWAKVKGTSQVELVEII